MKKIHTLDANDAIMTEYCSIRDDDSIGTIKVEVEQDKVDALLNKIKRATSTVLGRGGRIEIDDLCEATYFDHEGEKTSPQYHTPPSFELIFGGHSHGDIVMTSESGFCGRDDTFEIIF